MKKSAVAEFFDREATQYNRGPQAGMADLNRIIAATIEAGVAGKVLSVGGLWSQYRAELLGQATFTVLDASEQMLAELPDEGLVKAVGDARKLPFADCSFDHIVLPLVLHHITDQSATAARHNVVCALKEAHRVLRNGGSLWISEFVVARTMYVSQRILSPLTSRALGLFGIPLVIMHSGQFYRSVLKTLKYTNVTLERIESPLARPTDLVRPIIGLPVRIPRWCYPLRSVLIRATKL